MDLFRIGFITVTLIDIIDILAIAWLFYQLYQIFRGTRAAQMLVGLAVIMFASFLFQALNFSGMSWLLRHIQTIWVIAFVILFQPELRRVLIYIGQNQLFQKIIPSQVSRTVDEVVQAVVDLSKRRWGGLIVMQQDAGLKGIIEKGVPIKANVSSNLIVSIFNPSSPLHDGAIIIHEDTIEAAKCILPLSERLEIDPNLGTRHLAALGLSEESDAMVVVVSEETGRVSLAHEGILNRNLDEDLLKAKLSKTLISEGSS
ncbi:MAG: diadenylate cyclase CdaA [Candidatus Marinimicrobia bacterium]|nr:diadenylate cyclase CdaA [Candidatus Neomarinimicrobiota bacterium]MCF7828980.1 diadenylate cyclase CdaA [Candidatus Neomarinimicrobiota bacterium]MCF7879940.1 diadenylate cyclase CdaA [Candidatus Neomarinimicrobiota bacterium]